MSQIAISPTTITHVRRKRAWLLVGIALFVLLLAGSIPAAANANNDVNAQETRVKNVWKDLSGGASLQDALENAGFVTIGDTSDPPWLSEIATPETLDHAYATKDYSTIGWECSSSAQVVADELDRDLSSRGWTKFESGQTGLATYTKEKGECRWLMTEVVETGKRAGVVLHIGRTS